MSTLERLLELIYPPRCPFCRSLLNDREKGICTRCGKSLPYVPELGQGRELKNIAKSVAPLYYEGEVRRSLLRYKFSGLTAYRQVYGELIAKCIDENEISCDIITWAPLSRRRLRKRGYDQARLIAQAAAKTLGLPCQRLLDKTRDNPPQSAAGDAAKRRANARGVYALHRGADVKGRRILIVDDIITTGATASECAGVLRAAGAVEIYAAAVARGRD